MRNSRRNGIDRSDIDDDESTPPTLAEVDAALYGKLARVDGTRRAVERTRFGAFKITPRGLEIGEGAQQKDWEEVGQFIFQVESGIQWLIGDWIAYGENVQWGKLRDISDFFGREEQTLSNYASVARKIEFSRRRENLSFAHHESVAKYPPELQDQYLLHAEAQGFNRQKFREWLRANRAKTKLALPISTDIEPQEWAEILWDVQRLSSDPRSISSMSLEERRDAARRLKKLVRQLERGDGGGDK